MIKINLLIKPRSRIRWRVVGLTGLVAGLVGLLGLGAFNWVDEMQRLEAELAMATNLQAEYRRVAAERPALEAQLSQAEGLAQGVALLGRNQRFSQAAAIEPALRLPAGVHLNDLTVQGADLMIQGESPSFAAAMEYLRYLRSLPSFMAVTEQSLTTANTGATTFRYRVQIRPAEEVAAP